MAARSQLTEIPIHPRPLHLGFTIIVTVLGCGRCGRRGVGGERSLHHRVLTSRRFAADVRRCDQLRIRMLAFVDNLQYRPRAQRPSLTPLRTLDEDD
jgi:hypothetical protein